MAEELHGGRLWAMARELRVEPLALLDASASVNPAGPPEAVLALLRRADPAHLTAYPDDDAPRLRARLCARHDAADENLVLGAGGAALLFLALRALAPRRVLVPLPCFREQPRAIAACGAELIPHPMPCLRLELAGLDPAGAGCDAVLLTNPHNPTGQLLPRAELEVWLDHHPETTVLVDEAFMDYAPEESLLPAVLGRPRTVVLRSLTKFFAMPALRVGYAFADAATAARMRAHQESWPVGQLELMAAEGALSDSTYAERSLAFFRREAPRFAARVAALGVKVHPSAAPFLLVELRTESGRACAEALLAQGILVRTCAAWPGLGDRYLRLALRGPEEQDRLLTALRAVL